MVIFFEWHRTAVDQKSSSSLPMTGEDTGLGALASPLVGYLGKVQERAASLEHCPWCTSKGLTCVLRSYRINLQESITLCTNPQCLFPLVSRSLEDVLASLDPVKPTVGNKRKNALVLEKEELIGPVHKRLRPNELDSLGQQSITDTLISQVGHGALNVVSNGQHAAPKTPDENLNGYSVSPGAELLRDEDDFLDQEPENAACTYGLTPPACLTPAGHLPCSSEATLTADGDESAFVPHLGAPDTAEAEDDFREVKSPPEVLNGRFSLDSNQSSFTGDEFDSTGYNTTSLSYNEESAKTEQRPLNADLILCKDIGGIKSETEVLFSTTITTESDELVSVPNQLFWSNSDKLCWLDSLLVALVNCKSLRRCKPKVEPQRSPVWQLMRGYEDVYAAIQVHQQTGRDGDVRVPIHVLQKANADLQSLRMSIFKLLQPMLHCKLGQRETPVFAIPLLLKMDSWAETLFQSTFQWEFKCSECKTATKERVIKTLPTFTNVLPDWRPLDAVHLAPCNVCWQKNQRRTMMLESVPAVFELHFVEGLPDNDVRIYTFTFKGKRYSISTVIQYNHQLQHFVTWISNSDGSWLEYDDLKHPDCKTHQKLPVPAQEMHVVFWEVEEDKEPRACSPSSTFPESPPCKNEMNPSLSDKGLTVVKLLTCATDQSLLTSHNDTDSVRALSASDDGSSSFMDTTVTAEFDTSIGSTTLLDAFEGLSHNDIITLTMVEIKVDSEIPPLNDNEQTKDLSVPSRDQKLDSTPDSSSAVMYSEASHNPAVELSSLSNSSESVEGSSSDPTFVPGVKRGRGRGRAVDRGKRVGRQIVGRQIVKKAAVPKAALHISPPASLEPSKVISSEPESAAADDTPPVETAQQAAPLSSTDKSLKSPTMPPQQAHWSFLLSKHPVNQLYKSIANLTPSHTPISVTQAKPTPPTRSTPNPVRKPQTPGGLFHKPQLRTEESEGLPLKAAEMYGGFGAKRSITPSPLPSYALLNGKSKLCQPITSNHQKSLTNTTVVSGTSLSMPGATRLSEMSSLKKHSSQSSKLPPGLSDTEALRYKLIKKLKAKKKKLAKLNEMLGYQGRASLRPDSTDLGSPNTVTSSTYDGSICGEFLSDLLSPATTASNLSPDSTGFLEMLADGQVDQLTCGVNAAGAVQQMNAPNAENFLEEFLSQAVAQTPTEMETDALSELFV
ncbi:LOW QUALITY PROTEIN: SUMO-specific isopeptidase USPL1 [Cottoperca gobio]|uniref:LOW QUALITY PROTEIN: SUMO-specific isopeptidase USPL1 n=1 Tax=Cottoperca gobio TaxID=56716 RepID=A0A6J2R0V8_COTGO|nr:LOW QUALITY PROTEIN: SUMO-specific isopeptidase USPL1 [Cottoperca gobio]